MTTILSRAGNRYQELLELHLERREGARGGSAKESLVTSLAISRGRHRRRHRRRHTRPHFETNETVASCSHIIVARVDTVSTPVEVSTSIDSVRRLGYPLNN